MPLDAAARVAGGNISIIYEYYVIVVASPMI